MIGHGGTTGSGWLRPGHEGLTATEEVWVAGGCYLTVAKLRLEILDGHDAGASRVFGRERVVIGSHDSADFVVRDSSVSRMHCELIPSGTRVILRDLESKYGTAIQGVQVREATLTGTTTLDLGHTRVRLTLGGDPAYLPLYDGERLGPLLGRATAMRRAFALAAAAAETDSAVLIEGEPGTGKRAFAGAIHERSDRADHPLLVLACADTPRELLESELFGHDHGTAASSWPGIFEAANGGAVLLEDIGELPIELQPKLLAILERREVRRIGGAQPIPIDVRAMATTSRNLAPGINGHRFRSDLHARLATIQVALPPLRARLVDLPLLVADIANRLELGPDDRAWLTSQALLAELSVHHWPGNLHELRSYLEACVALRIPGVIDALGSEPLAMAVDTSRPFHAARSAWTDVFDRSYAIAMLRRYRGHVAAAARAAGMDRLAFHRLLWRLGIR